MAEVWKGLWALGAIKLFFNFMRLYPSRDQHHHVISTLKLILGGEDELVDDAADVMLLSGSIWWTSLSSSIGSCFAVLCII